MSVGSLSHQGLRPSLSRRRSTPADAYSASSLLAVGGLVVLAAALRFYAIGRQGFLYDEANTAQLVHFSVGKMLGLLPQSESTPPLYYCVAWVWARIFGETEAGLRSLSAVAGVLTVPVAYAIGAKLISRRGGLIVAALTACSPLLIWYSQEARSYELLVLLCALSLLGFVHARAAPTRPALTGWVVASALALATHYYAIVVVIPEAVWLLAEHRRRRAVLVAVGVVGLCGLALIPLAISQNGTGHDGWIATAAFGPRLRQIVPQFLIGTNAPHRLAVKYAAMALALVALGLLALGGRTAERRAAAVAAVLAVGGFVISLLTKAVGFDDLITRNIIALWLPAALVVASGLATARWRALGVAVTAGLCAIGIFATAGIAANRSMQRPDWRHVARALGARPAARGTVGRAILVQHYSYLLPLSLYLPHLRVMTRPERLGEIDVISMTSPQQPLCWWGAACNLIPSRMQRRYDIRGFRAVSRRHVRQWTILTLVARRPVTVTPTAVSHALHTTTLRRDELIYQPG